MVYCLITAALFPILRVVLSTLFVLSDGTAADHRFFEHFRVSNTHHFYPFFPALICHYASYSLIIRLFDHIFIYILSSRKILLDERICYIY